MKTSHKIADMRNNGSKIVYVDIDDTICRDTGEGDNLDYTKREPIEDNIEIINNLYDKGHVIIYWTARGTGSGTDWSTETTVQLKKWGCKFHRLVFGKPIYDVFIDDKNLNAKRISELEDIIENGHED